MVWKTGESGNPDGRPMGSLSRVPTDKEMKDSFKKNCPEAVNHLVEYMRGNAKSAKAHQKNIDAILKDMLSAEPDKQQDLVLDLSRAMKARDTSDDRVLKASIKLIDVTYNITVNDDKLKLTRKKLRLMDKRGAFDGDKSDDNDDDDYSPVMSLKSV